EDRRQDQSDLEDMLARRVRAHRSAAFGGVPVFACSGCAGPWQSRHEVWPLMRFGISSLGWPAAFRNFCEAPWHPRHRTLAYGLAILIGRWYAPVVYRHTWPRPANFAWSVPPKP